jgi:hypothetical protein
MLLGRVALQVPRPEHLIRAQRTRPLQVRLARVIGGQQRLGAVAASSLAVQTHLQPQARLHLEERPVRGPAERASRPHSAALPSELMFDQATAQGSAQQCLDLASPLSTSHCRPRRRPDSRRRAEGVTGAASLPERQPTSSNSPRIISCELATCWLMPSSINTVRRCFGDGHEWRVPRSDFAEAGGRRGSRHRRGGAGCGCPRSPGSRSGQRG